MIKTVAFLLRRIDCNDGVASHLVTLMRGLRARGVNVVMLAGKVSSDERTRIRHDALSDLASVWITLPLLSGKPWLSVAAARRIADALRTSQVDVLHLHGLSVLPLARLATIMMRRPPPIIATAHPSGSSAAEPSAAVRRLVRWTSPAATRLGWPWPDGLIAVSSEMRGWFVDTLAIPSGRVATICNGVDVEHFRPPNMEERRLARESFGLRSDEFVCTLVGRMEPVKRHDVLLKAIARLNAHGVAIRTLFVGGGDGEAAIRQRADALGVAPLVRFCGFPPDPRPAYWASDAVVLPSEREAFALTVAEGMLCGAVPLRTPTGGARDQIVDGVTGFLFPCGSDETLAQQLQLLATHPARRAEMALAAGQHARERFDAHVMADRTIRFYDAIART